MAALLIAAIGVAALVSLDGVRAGYGDVDVLKDTSAQLRAGARVALNYCNGREAAERAFAEYRDAGLEGGLFQANVTDPADVARLCAEVAEELAPIDRALELEHERRTREAAERRVQELFAETVMLRDPAEADFQQRAGVCVRVRAPSRVLAEAASAEPSGGQRRERE